MINPGEYYAWIGSRNPAHRVPTLVGVDYGSVYGTAVCGARPWSWYGHSEVLPVGKALCRRCFRKREETST